MRTASKLNISAFVISMAAGLLLSGCVSRDRVTFFTATKLAIDADATTQSLSFGRDRAEGVLGPAYETGGVPPLVAKLDSTQSLLKPVVKQFYATGNAAILASCEGGILASKRPCPNADELEAPPLSGDRRLMFFGTSTVIGFKLSWAGNVPEAITLGYKRKEFSSLPIGMSEPRTASAAGGPRNLTVGHNHNDGDQAEDTYGSVLASLDLSTDVTDFNNTSLKVNQFFATGVAADNLATTVRSEVEKAAVESARRSLEIISLNELTPSTKTLTDIVAPAGNVNVAVVDRMRKECWPQFGVPADTPVSEFVYNPRRFEKERVEVLNCLDKAPSTVARPVFSPSSAVILPSSTPTPATPSASTINLLSILAPSGEADAAAIDKMKTVCWPIAGIPMDTPISDFVFQPQFETNRPEILNCVKST
ncbi:MAG: hypothetical protein WAS21_16335 [Geminicoccaceae bacterium]